ncbi:hypothetical protein [Xanthomonas campestris]|uniref:hypothetical protein n=1 Tax=Xanthomonas campestris TaxID=339 RepID=UPI0012A90E02|nr:hypothetical protein [Xanthomonas campestris]MEB1634897.1 hypothetical protein [Xanthomonas campestris pv. campestris]WDI87078.1 hypothetical protein JH281_08125 [Xanthomonas campestris pv. campestris]BBJ94310.1 hypothetical protein Xcc1_00400 [Xanthomonas campestris pv. campestris]
MVMSLMEVMEVMEVIEVIEVVEVMRGCSNAQRRCGGGLAVSHGALCTRVVVTAPC